MLHRTKKYVKGTAPSSDEYRNLIALRCSRQFRVSASLPGTVTPRKTPLIEYLHRAWREEDGQDLVEYSLLLAFMALASVGILSGVSRNVVTLWQDLSNAFSTGLAGAS